MARCKFLWALLIGSAAPALTSCDPVQDSIVAALGPEVPGTPPGPNHRPGQPCVACHRDDGQAKPTFAMAGTIYREKGTAVALGNVDIELTDKTGHKVVTRSNCAGNFYLAPEAFTLSYPIWVVLRSGAHSIEMESPIYREGSCATCHANPVGPMSAGPVFLTDEPAKAQMFLPCR